MLNIKQKKKYNVVKSRLVSWYLSNSSWLLHLQKEKYFILKAFLQDSLSSWPIHYPHVED